METHDYKGNLGKICCKIVRFDWEQRNRSIAVRDFVYLRLVYFHEFL